MTHLRSSPLAAVLLLLATVGCTVRESACGRKPAEGVSAAASAEAQATTSSTGTNRPIVLKVAVLGDSLTAGFGLLETEAYPALLQEKLDADGYEVEVINAGISGDTTAGGLRRVEWVLEPGVRILIVALGGNDALRGLSTQQTYDNLSAIIQTAKAKGVMVLLAGMNSPTNLGKDYRDAFSGIYPRLAREHKVTLLPFLLEGVAGVATLNQEDGIHPTADGQRLMADLVYPVLQPMVDDALSR